MRTFTATCSTSWLGSGIWRRVTAPASRTQQTQHWAREFARKSCKQNWSQVQTVRFKTIRIYLSLSHLVSIQATSNEQYPVDYFEKSRKEGIRSTIMVCIQCYLPPILFMIYMKLLHPFLAPFIEPAVDKVVGWIWGTQAVQAGCPIRPKSKRTNETAQVGGEEPSASRKAKDD